jgi:glycerophosphoryl diester phosphodiesterase
MPDTTPATTSPAAPSTTQQPRARTVADLLGLGRPIVLAHTGGEDEFPASTLFAFARSAAAGVDMLDLNVQLSADGVLVVHHDDTVDRATNGTGALAELTAAELHALDDAYWFTADCVCTGRPDADYIYRGIRSGERPPPPGSVADDFAIPTFRELVQRFPDLPLNIEIKGTGQPAIAAARVLADELTELGRLDAAVVTSFDDGVVTAFHQMAPTVEVSPGLDLTTKWVLQRTPLPDGMRILQLPPAFNGIEVITPELIADSTAAGYPIWVWPDDRSLENLTSYRAFLDEGILGLNINFPEQGVTAVQMYIGTPG